MMGSRPIIIALCSVHGALMAQPELTVANSFPIAGDVFTELEGVASGPGGPGAGQVWDFSAFQPTDTFVINYADEVSDSIDGCALACPLDVTSGAYVVAVDPFSVMVAPWFGFPIGSFPIIHEFGIVLEAPMTFEDTVMNLHLYRLLSSGCDGAEFWRSDTNMADGYGTVVLPFGTYGPVLRVHTVMEQVDPTADPLHAYRFHLPGTHHPLVTIAQGFPEPLDTTWTMRMLDPASIVGMPEEPAIGGLRTWPQPVQDILFVQTAAVLRDISGLAILDAGGRVVQEHDVRDLHDGLDVRALAPGIYVLRVIRSAAPALSARFIKSIH